MLLHKIEKNLIKTAKQVKTLQFSMRIPAQEINYSYSSTVPNQTFHSASVGKLMTTTLIFIAIEKGKIDLDSKVSSILEHFILDNLFVFEGKDYQGEVTVRQLLGHTSGINDYFESKTMDGSNFIDEIIKNPNQFWEPKHLLDFTRNRQKALAKPGSKFFYSDTGYVLLGLLLEALFEMPFHQALETYIFEPAKMKDTGLCFYSDGFKAEHLAPLSINGVDVHLFNSVSCDFSGGGLYTTSDDLVSFLQCLYSFVFISQHSLNQMSEFTNRYRQGLHYGLGMMQLVFGEFFFLLKGLPHLHGHLGVTGVHAWIDPKTNNVFAMNVGDTKAMAKSFKLLIVIIQLLEKATKKSKVD